MHTPPVYLVVGWMRSGTSMMMHALKEGGMNVTSGPEATRRILNMRHWSWPN